MSQEKITLTVPSRGEYAKTVRMTASALVSRMGMTIDDLEDVRMAAEEAFVYACDHAPPSGAVVLEFGIEGDVFEMRVTLPERPHLTDEDAERRAGYATFILQSVTDMFEMSSDEHGPYLRIMKRASGELADANG